MDYRKLEVREIQALIKILNLYKEEIGELPLSQEASHNLYQAIEKQAIIFFIAWHEDKMIGTCSISPCFSTYECKPMAVFEDFYILPNYRKQGFGKKLVDHAIFESRARGITSIWVGACDDDLDMYKKLGFDLKLGNLLACNGS